MIINLQKYKQYSYIDAVSARQKDPPELAVLGGVVGDIAAFHLDAGAFHWIPVLIHDKPVRATVHLC